MPPIATPKATVIGRRFIFTFAADAVHELHFLDETHFDVVVVADPSYAKGTLNHFDVAMTEIRHGVFMITWVEPAMGNTVTHVDDFAALVAHTNITDLASKSFWRLTGKIEPR